MSSIGEITSEEEGCFKWSIESFREEWGKTDVWFSPEFTYKNRKCYLKLRKVTGSAVSIKISSYGGSLPNYFRHFVEFQLRTECNVVSKSHSKTRRSLTFDTSVYLSFRALSFREFLSEGFHTPLHDRLIVLLRMRELKISELPADDDFLSDKASVEETSDEEGTSDEEETNSKKYSQYPAGQAGYSNGSYAGDSSYSQSGYGGTSTGAYTNTSVSSSIGAISLPSLSTQTLQQQQQTLRLQRLEIERERLRRRQQEILREIGNPALNDLFNTDNITSNETISRNFSGSSSANSGGSSAPAGSTAYGCNSADQYGSNQSQYSYGQQPSASSYSTRGLSSYHPLSTQPNKQESETPSFSNELNPNQPSEALEKMQKDFKSLLDSGENNDVTFVVGGKKFPAHRTILCARSPVFKAMLCHDTTERDSGTVNIDDSAPDNFLDFLTYVYTGSTRHINAENVFSLYTTSDKYLMNELKEACVSFMKANMSVEGFCGIAILALRHGDKELLESLTNFFYENVKEIIETENWVAFIKDNPNDAYEHFMKPSLSRR